MARNRKYSQLDDMQGSIGRIIVSRNRYGSFTYEKPEYFHKSTPAQKKTQHYHKQVLKLWQTLSPKEIMPIDRQAADQDIRRMCHPAEIVTGYSLFYYLKRNLQEIGEPLTNKVPLITSGAQFIPNFMVEIKKNKKKPNLKLYMGDNIDTNNKLIIYATHSVPGGICRAKDSWYRKISVLDSSFKQGNYITTDYLNVFKSIDTEAMSIFFKFKTVDKRSGMASNPILSIFTLSIKEKS